MKRRKKKLYEKLLVLHLKKLKFPSPKDALCQGWLKLAQWFWRRRFLNFVNVFSLFHYYLPLEKGGTLHLNKLESPSPRDTLCQVWLNKRPTGLNGHLSIRDFTLTSCQKGSYLYINSPIIE